jgi:hypothetical protein
LYKDNKFKLIGVEANVKKTSENLNDIFDEHGKFAPGNPGGPGRPPGQPNKVTRDMKEFFQALVEENQDRVIAAMERLFVTKPEAFMSYFIQSSEFVLPKLKRNEHVGKDGERLFYTDDQAAKILERAKKKKT